MVIWRKQFGTLCNFPLLLQRSLSHHSLHVEPIHDCFTVILKKALIWFDFLHPFCTHWFEAVWYTPGPARAFKAQGCTESNVKDSEAMASQKSAVKDAIMEALLPSIRPTTSSAACGLQPPAKKFLDSSILCSWHLLTGFKKTVARENHLKTQWLFSVIGFGSILFLENGQRHRPLDEVAFGNAPSSRGMDFLCFSATNSVSDLCPRLTVLYTDSHELIHLQVSDSESEGGLGQEHAQKMSLDEQPVFEQ